MSLTLVAGSSNPALSSAVSAALGAPLADCRIQRFPDGELQVEVGANVRGHDVYVLQGTHPPVGEHVLELLLIADAYRRAGAARVTGVVPYLGYGRQDRRSRGRESLGARLIADLLGGGRLDRIISVDLHSAAVEGCFDIPVEHLSAAPLLAKAVGDELDRTPELRAHAVIVSPDLGAVKLAERYATLLQLPLAIVHKIRTSGAEVTAQGVVGDVRGKAAILVDDMVTTAGTMAAAAAALRAQGALPEVTVVATHGLLVGPAVERLAGMALARLITTDSVPAPTVALPFAHPRCSLGPLLAEVLRRLHDGRSTADLAALR